MLDLLLGNEAVALGAAAAGVRVVSSYPGTPSTEITEAAARYESVACEWAPNEKVGLEVALGASLAGARAMSCMKHVGLNVAADPLFTASYTGVGGGLVVVVADDPGLHSSQNEQDSRQYARAAKLPMLEPWDSQTCKDMTAAAFELSETYDTPVLIRLTTRVSHTRSPVTTAPVATVPLRSYEKNVAKNVMMPAMAIGRHKAVEERMARLEAAQADKHANIGHHQIIWGDRRIGFIAAGIAAQRVREALPKASLFRVGMVWPLPIEEIRAYAAQVERLVVVEELDPFIETELRAAGIACEGKALFAGAMEESCRIRLRDDLIAEQADKPISPPGSWQGLASLQGEYTTDLIRCAFGIPRPFTPAVSRDELDDAAGRPPVLCAGCPHKGLFLALGRMKLVVHGDIGCYTLGALAPTSAMDSCVCMGASVGMTHGWNKARPDHRKAVAVIGDSTFLHSGMTGLLNCVYNQSDSVLIILDNSITGMTGHQQNPATGKNIRLQPAPAVDLEALCRALGVESVQVFDPADPDAARAAIQAELDRPGVSVLIARRPCALIPAGRGSPERSVRCDERKCVRCQACLRILCPALTPGEDGVPRIDDQTCNACGLCVRVCRFGALSVGEVRA